jgi:predicted Rossmann fold nucleotide-binding protein DprA/Smf involved in DNA uptake
MLSARTQATILLTVPFPNEGNSFSPLTPTEWGRFAAWLHARSLMPESLLAEPLPALLTELEDKSIRRERIEALLGRGAALGLLMDKWSRAGLWVMTRADADYPPRLKRRLGGVSPAVLFGCGNRKLLSGGGLAVVGSRKAGPDELAYSRRLGELAAINGQSVVSGAARGIDEAAMLGALQSEGTAVGVLASDLLRTTTAPGYRDYITRNNLTFISAVNPETRFNVGNAMGRNKYIYCLADAAVVVHSGLKGGTWSGAMENLKKGWVPLWVRSVDDREAGNGRLLSEPNARLLARNIDQVQINGLVDPAASTPYLTGGRGELRSDASQAVAAPPPTPPSPITPEMSLYELFLTKVRPLCRNEPCRPDELGQALGLQSTQLKIWLDQAVEEGHLTRLNKPVRYQSGTQGTLFEA